MKMNLKLIMAIGVVTGCISATAGAVEGTGVGNGGNSARDQYLAKLQRELRAGATSQGVNHPDQLPDRLVDWCSRVSTLLVRERQRAMLQYQYNRKAQAEQTLIDALATAAQSLDADTEIGGPMTKKLLDRALMSSQALDQALADGGALAQVTKLNFLFQSVDFIVRVARELDPPYYIPYRYRYGGCPRGCPPEFSFPTFEAQFVQLAARQLTFVTEALTDTRVGNGGVETFPLGDPRAFLSVAELTTAFVAHDLRENLFAYANACVIRDLEGLSQNLTAYNLYGDRSVFPNSRWAVAQTAEQMSRMAEQIRLNAGGCR